ncbi:MAG: cytochrome c biogenesis protein CcsA [Spirochaetales bacterium]|nr:cytochrome c biogenesis protein CcsA [Spirochaetales bacterium]
MGINYAFEAPFLYAGFGLLGLLIISEITLFFIRKKIKISQYLWVVRLAIFVLFLCGYLSRWIVNQSPPMKGMYDVFFMVCLFIYPVAYLTMKKSQVAVGLFEDFLLFVFLFPLSFVFESCYEPLPPALQSNFFIPHVAFYMLSYVFVFLAAKSSSCALYSIRQSSSPAKFDGSVRFLMKFGFFFYSLGLFIGSVWGHYAWGRFWGWDPKELWSLVTWLTIGLYFHVRYFWGKASKFAYVVVFLAVVAIIITLLVVNLSRIFSGVHNYA